MPRDYALTGEGARAAEERGLANPSWYRPDIDPQAIRALMEKSDAIAFRDTALWIGVMVVSAGIGIALWPSWWSAPFWLIYGVMYGSASDSRWHECGHQDGFQDPVDERCRLPDRKLHADAEPGDLAGEPRPPPHRHDHRRPRSRNRGNAPRRTCCASG